MDFVGSDEYIILMDMAEVANPGDGRYTPMREDEMVRLRDVGVRTVLEQAQWELAEPESGMYSWSRIDDQVNRCRRAGMKVLLCVPGCVPRWFPIDWYARTNSPGSPIQYTDWRWWPTLSLWNERAQFYMAEFEARVIDRYAASDVLVIHGYPKDGETMLPPMGEGYFDPHALASFRAYSGSNSATPDYHDLVTLEWLRDTVVETNILHQRLVAGQPGGETWCFLHPYHARYPWTGCGFVGDVYAALQDRGWKVNAVQYTHFPLGDDQANQVRAVRAAVPGVEFWAGAEYADGLAENTPKAIAQGLRGLVCAPLHPFQGRARLEGWMVDNFRESMRQFGEARHDS